MCPMCPFKNHNCTTERERWNAACRSLTMSHRLHFYSFNFNLSLKLVPTEWCSSAAWLEMDGKVFVCHCPEFQHEQGGKKCLASITASRPDCSQTHGNCSFCNRKANIPVYLHLLPAHSPLQECHLVSARLNNFTRRFVISYSIVQ